jgi:hypothetical protein
MDDFIVDLLIGEEGEFTRKKIEKKKEKKINNDKEFDLLRSCEIQLKNHLVNVEELKQKLGKIERVIKIEEIIEKKICKSFIIFGCVVEISDMKKSVKGSIYYILKLSNLREKFLSIFVFQPEINLKIGSVIVVRNPKILESVLLVILIRRIQVIL